MTTATSRPGGRLDTRIVVAAIVAALAGPAPAAANAVEREDLGALAEKAQRSPAALERLREVERVDGAPIDMARLLDAPPGAELDARLRALAGGEGEIPAAAPIDAGAARARAEEILAESRFKPAPIPRPLRSVFERIGMALERAFGGAAALVPGGPPVVWIAAGLATLLAALALASRAVSRRGRLAPRPGGPAVAGLAEDPRDLERQAEAAERAGHRAEALRLRFRAGLLRLDAAGAIRLRPSLATGEVARELRSPTFDRLAAEFDAVAYGGRRPAQREVEAAAAGWAELLGQGRSR